MDLTKFGIKRHIPSLGFTLAVYSLVIALFTAYESYSPHPGSPATGPYLQFLLGYPFFRAVHMFSAPVGFFLGIYGFHFIKEFRTISLLSIILAAAGGFFVIHPAMHYLVCLYLLIILIWKLSRHKDHGSLLIATVAYAQILVIATVIGIIFKDGFGSSDWLTEKIDSMVEHYHWDTVIIPLWFIVTWFILFAFWTIIMAREKKFSKYSILSLALILFGGLAFYYTMTVLSTT